MAAHLQVIEARVIDEKKPATFRWLSRRLNVNVNSAKCMLWEFVQFKKSSDIATLFYVQGQRPDKSIVSMIVSEAKLKAIQSDLVRSSVHVHSVHPARSISVEAAAAVDAEVLEQDTLESMRICRTIVLPEKAYKVATIPAKNNANQPTMQQQSKQPAAVESNSARSHSKPLSKQESIGNDKKAPSSKASFFPSTPRETKPATHASKPAAPEPKIQKSTSAVHAPSTKTREPAPRSSSAASAQSRMHTEQIIKMFEEDEDDHASGHTSKRACHASNQSVDRDEDNQDKIDHEKTNEDHANSRKRSLSSSVVKSRSKKIQLSADSDESDNEGASRSAPKHPDATQSGTNDDASNMNVDDDDAQGQAKRVRKRRRVKRTRTYMDGKYMKTVDEWDWESYSEEENPSHTKSESAKPQGASKLHSGRSDLSSKRSESSDTHDDHERSKDSAKSKKRGVQEGQKTLLSFFGKRN